MSNPDDLTKMIPEAKTITVGGETIPIVPIKVKQLSATIKAAAPLMAHFKNSNPGEIDIFSLVSSSIDDAIELVAQLSGKPREWIEELEIPELVDLTSALVEANVDFFTKSVLPSVLRAMGQLSPSLQSLGNPQLVRGPIPSNV
jgi:hypothetical protein